MTNRLYGGTINGTLQTPTKNTTSTATDLMSKFREVEKTPVATFAGIPSLPQINAQNQQSISSIGMPNLSVYTPDYGALEKSFQDILSSYEGYKSAAQAQYGAQKGSLDTNLEQQMQSIGTAKGENKQAFAEGRGQLAEDVFMLNRQTQATASARGLGGSGVEAMANIQNRMAAGESMSNMANEYFDAQTQLVEAEQATRQNYDNSLQNLNASLQSTMAQIMSQEASSKMDYTQTIDNLKRQVVADTNAMKQAQYEWQVANEQALQGAKILETDIQRMLASGESVAIRVSNLIDAGYTPANANAKVLQFDNTQKTTADRQLYTGLQSQIDNLRSQGVSATNIKKQFQAMEGASGINFNRLDFNGTGTAKQGSQQFIQNAASGYVSPQDTVATVIPFLGQSGMETQLPLTATKKK